MLFYTMDLVLDITVHLEESLEDLKEDSMLDPQKRVLYGMGLPTMDVLGRVSHLHLGPIFTPVELKQPDLLPLLLDIVHHTRSILIVLHMLP